MKPRNFKMAEPQKIRLNFGFETFKRRIYEQLALYSDDYVFEDLDLFRYYQIGESETFVLSALGANA